MTRLAPRPTPDRGDESAALLPREDPIRNLPLLVLYPHSRCNCRCVMCDIWRASGRRELSTAEITRWLPEWKRLGVRRVVLSGGEPLLHSHLSTVLDALREGGIGVTLLTTGLLLRRHAERVAAYCDDVIVSLDGPKAVHDQIRNIPHAYDRLAVGVAALRAQGAAVTISGRCTVQRANFRSLRETVAAAHELGLERLSFLAADVSTEAFNRPGGWGQDRVGTVALHTEDLSDLERELERLTGECDRDFKRGFIVETPAKLEERLLRYFSALLGQGAFPQVVCNAPWVSAVVEADGGVRPCFFQPVLGNLREAGSLEAVLNAPGALRWRAGLDMARNEICRKCVCSLALRGPAPSPAGPSGG